MRFFDELAAKIVLLKELRWTLSNFNFYFSGISVSLGSLSLDLSICGDGGGTGRGRDFRNSDSPSYYSISHESSTRCVDKDVLEKASRGGGSAQ